MWNTSSVPIISRNGAFITLGGQSTYETLHVPQITPPPPLKYEAKEVHLVW